MNVLHMGLDVGTGFVKCVSEQGALKFPSLFGYRDPSKWETAKERIELVGDDAKQLEKYNDAVILRPVIEGRPINDKAFAALVKHAAKKFLNGSAEHVPGNISLSESVVVVGLPYEAKDDKTKLKSIIQKTINPKRVVIVPQAIGTLFDVKLTSGVVVSIGQGTSEIVYFEDKKPVMGTSLPQATDFITQKHGEFAYLSIDSVLKKPDVRKDIEKLTDVLANRIISYTKQIPGSPQLVISGGGILIPGLQESLDKKLKIQYTLPEDPVMSNARGLYLLAIGR